MYLAVRPVLINFYIFRYQFGFCIIVCYTFLFLFVSLYSELELWEDYVRKDNVELEAIQAQLNGINQNFDIFYLIFRLF